MTRVFFRSRRRLSIAASVSAIIFGLTTQILAQTIQQIAGSDFTYILKADGTVSGYGREDKYGAFRADGNGIKAIQPLPFPGKVKQLAAGWDAQFALMQDGSVIAWGMNDRGQFGRGPGSSRTPDNPLRSASPITVPLPNDVVQIVAAGHFGLAVRSNGAVLTWGENPASETLADVAIKTIKDLPPVTAVAAGSTHVIALTKDGKVYAWGLNKNGQLGTEPSAQMSRSRKPLLVAGLDNVVSIAAEGTTNFGFSGAVKADGTVWMWGSNQSATMGTPLFWGNNGPPGNVNATPTKVAGITNAKSIVVGTGHVAVLLADKTLRMWGHDGWGQIGVGTSGFYQPSPKKPAITNVAAVYTISNRTYAVKTDGTLWWWGPAAISAAGSAIGQDRKVPTQITGTW